MSQRDVTDFSNCFFSRRKRCFPVGATSSYKNKKTFDLLDHHQDPVNYYDNEKISNDQLLLFGAKIDKKGN